jgi:hypothetical protein
MEDGSVMQYYQRYRRIKRKQSESSIAGNGEDGLAMQLPTFRQNSAAGDVDDVFIGRLNASSSLVVRFG